MVNEEHLQKGGAVFFGPFSLRVAQRRLEREDKPVELSSRALDILDFLIERAGEVVSKKELVARVWSDVTVDEGSLRFHIAALRKALGDGRSGARYITTLPGRGYCFVSPLSRSRKPVPVAEGRVFEPSHRLPPRLKRMVGREDTVQKISTLMAADRFVSIIGPGGIGKTTVAIAIGHIMLAEFDGAVAFFDLGPLNNPALVSSAVASTLGLAIKSSDPTPGLIAFLREKRMLLILDSCEHVIETAAAISEQLYQQAPQVHILTTSREVLRVEGEKVLQLSSLESPPDRPGLRVAEVLSFPAAQLFVDRVIASGYPLKLDDTDATMVGEICRRMDGIPLAIELAAGKVNAFGIPETAALLDNRFRLKGRRTALLRHQTLGATLDWSFGLLSVPERVVLSKLSQFVGAFTLEAAQDVASGPEISPEQAAIAVEALVAKSLVSADISSTVARYRLLDTTRAYALAKLVDSGVMDDVARRHASYFLAVIEQGEPPRVYSRPGNSHTLLDELGNVRVALEWCFSERGDRQLGIALAAVSTRLFFEMSLLMECHRWARKALAALDDANRGTRYEVDLQTAFGLSLMFTQGNSEQVKIAFFRGLELAEKWCDLPNQVRLLEKLHLFHLRIGNFREALACALRCESIADGLGDPIQLAHVRVALGISYHLKGDNRSARTVLESALAQLSTQRPVDAIHLGLDYRNRARITLARVLWIQGYFEQSVTVARHAIEEAISLDDSINLCMSLLWAVSIFMWSSALESAEEQIDRFIMEAEKHSLAPYQAIGHGLKGELLVRRGDTESGIVLLRRSLEALEALRYGLPTASSIALAQGLLAVGRGDDAMRVIDDGIALVEHNGDLFGMPELLRIKAEILKCKRDPDFTQAEAYLKRSLELGHRDSSLAWELRTATSLAQLWFQQGFKKRAHRMLLLVYQRFSEGFESADMIAAKGLLDELNELPDLA